MKQFILLICCILSYNVIAQNKVALQQEINRLKVEIEQYKDSLDYYKDTAYSLKQQITEIKNYINNYPQIVSHPTKTEQSVKTSPTRSTSSAYLRQVSTQCAATTQKGTRCKRTAQAGSKYCWQHQR